MLLLLGFILYFVPTAIAMCRGHGNCGAIFVLNLLLGWTFIGWVIALVWSFTEIQERDSETAKENAKGWRTAGLALFVGCAISLAASPFLPKDPPKKVDPVPKRFVIEDNSSPDAIAVPEESPVAYETPPSAPTPVPTPTSTPHHKRHHEV